MVVLALLGQNGVGRSLPAQSLDDQAMGAPITLHAELVGTIGTEDGPEGEEHRACLARQLHGQLVVGTACTQGDPSLCCPSGPSQVPTMRSVYGATVWFTGLPASGKSTIAAEVARRLRDRRVPPTCSTATSCAGA